MTLVLAFINFFIAITRLYFTFKSGRLISIAWFLIVYFSWFLIPVVTGGSFKHYRAFPGELVTISSNTIYELIVYVIIFNIIFMFCEVLFWKLVGPKVRTHDYTLPNKSAHLNRVQISLFALLCLGTVLYGITSLTQDYRDYVEYKGSSWGMVFLWASSSLIAILALRKKYMLALVSCLPFIYFAVHLKIRSFALLSLIPIAIVYMLQITTEGKAGAMKKIRKIVIGGVMFVGILMLSSAIMMDKSGTRSKGFNLPDSGMPFGTAILMELTNKYNASTEWDSLVLYGRNLINPFLKITGSARTDIVDPPVVMAQLYDGVPVNWGVYYHYPTLWYMDSYLSFAYYGLFLAIFWAFIFVLWEVLMSRNALIFGLLLPFYTWHAYMLIRGATAGATVPFSYAVYITFILSIALAGMKVFSKRGGLDESTANNK